ncbi:exonuclease SbcCD subunit D [Methanosarcina sp. KYL-1]|uniref:metallophosphoesterase n=1 Tax=Methanosarcina sp. KYL-1 TaxID=2602068 RepID=UPI002100C538|nr:metallophosphoesterase [Methanosarcina sp. KYL-1]MCQ1536876.1 exonuclease SbcCD subunit D [Methanosarcina sp. KYL-1]
MDREIRILHTADTHLGYRQYHSEVRRKDFFDAFEAVIKDAIEMQVDAVVHAGDLFDSRNPTLEDLLDTINILGRLKAADIPLLAIVGNHESKQNTQWLDLFEEMGIAVRLGKVPCMVGDVAVYGIDSVPKSKIPIFDYSGFELPELPEVLEASEVSEVSEGVSENGKKLLVMHQIMTPFPYGEWDCAEVLENIPFKVDAILLGDYHKYEKIKVGETWVTYSGSTERNSASESEPRSYNIITLSAEGVEISRRTIPTRKFLFISADLKGEDKPYEQIFAAVNEYEDDLPESVVFLEISGDSGDVLSFSDIEEYLLNKGVLVPRVRDLRVKDAVPEEVVKVSFADPDHAVAEEIKRMSLTDGGLIVDEIVRNPNVARSRVDEETESRLSELISAIDFKDPDFIIEVPGRAEEAVDSGYAEGAEEVEQPEYVDSPEHVELAVEAKEIELPAEVEVLAVTGSPEIVVNPQVESPEGIDTTTIDENAGPYESAGVPGPVEEAGISPVAADDLPEGPERKSLEGRVLEVENTVGAENAEKEEGKDSPVFWKAPDVPDAPEKPASPEQLAEEPTKEPAEEGKMDKIPSPVVSFSRNTSHAPPAMSLDSFKTASSMISPQKLSETPAESPAKSPEDIDFWKDADNRPDVENRGGNLPEEKPVKLEMPDKLENTEKSESEKAEYPEKAEKSESEKAGKPEIAGKPEKAGQKNGKGKPAVPRQYNLGDYL